MINSLKNPEWYEKYEQDAGYLFVPRCLLQTKSLPTSAAIVYAAIADDDLDGDGVIVVRQTRIVQRTGISRQQVNKAIAILIAADLLEPEPDRTGRANVYRLTTRILPPKKHKPSTA